MGDQMIPPAEWIPVGTTFAGDLARLTEEERRLLALVNTTTLSTSSSKLQDAEDRLATLQSKRLSLPSGTLPHASLSAAIIAGEQEVTRLKAEHEHAQERDAEAVRLGRPPGCWCLGLGGRGIVVVDEEDGTRIWTEWCICPEGRAGQALSDQHRVEWAAEEQAETDKARAAIIQVRLKESRIPFDMKDWTFETLLAHDPTKSNVVKFLQQWVQPERFPVQDGKPRGTGLFISGPIGATKTGLAIGLLRVWIENGGWGRFVPPVEYFEALRASFHSTNEDILAEAGRLEDDVRRAPLLVLDDLGTERTSPWVAERTFQLINQRMNERLPTIITSNLTMEEAVARLGRHSERQDQDAERLCSRLRKMSTMLKITGKAGESNDRRPSAPTVREIQQEFSHGR